MFNKIESQIMTNAREFPHLRSRAESLLDADVVSLQISDETMSALAADFADIRTDDIVSGLNFTSLGVSDWAVFGAGGAAGGEHFVGAALGLFNLESGDQRHWGATGLFNAGTTSRILSNQTLGTETSLVAHFVADSVEASLDFAGLGVSSWAVLLTGRATVAEHLRWTAFLL